VLPAVASHNLAGQITFRRVSGNRYEITLTTYTDPAPQGVDRCSASLEIWDANGNKITTLDSIPRSNGPLDTSNPIDCAGQITYAGEVFFGTVKKNIYIVEYDFPGPGIYQVRYSDKYRHGGIINMNDPDNTTFYVYNDLNIPNPILGQNNSPLFLNDPLDQACVGKLWLHNPGGFDPDGDSLVYELLVPQQYDPNSGVTPIPVSGYQYPDTANFGVSTFTIDTETGLITWNTPPMVGIYSVAFRVSEYRNGVKIGELLRDMSIFVDVCPNDPPIIESLSDTCVQAGDFMAFDFTAYDPNFPTDSLYFQLNNGGIGNNGPFAVSNAATISITQPVGGSIPLASYVDTVKGVVEWQTACENIRQSFYQVDFFAHDNISYIPLVGNSMLTAHKIVKIEVIPPRVRGLVATKGSRAVSLNWDASICDNVVGYNIYRRLGGNTWNQDTVCCDQSPEGGGFELVGYNEGWMNVEFVDSLLISTSNFGQDICYVVTGLYGDPFNPGIESCASDEACVQILNDQLYMTNDSVRVTDSLIGEVFVSWSQPDSIDGFFTGPFSYRLYRADDNQAPTTVIGDFLWDDTTYIDTDLDTKIRGYNYRVVVLDGLGLEVPMEADRNESSTIYLQALGGQNSVSLSWADYPAWQNSKYYIYRSDNGGAFGLLDSVTATSSNIHSYFDANLNPEVEYCYFIRSLGSHGATGIKDPLWNDSQIDCTFARDETPPCAPQADVFGDCENLIHFLTITKPDSANICDDDADFLTIYFGPTEGGPWTSLMNLDYDSFEGDTLLTFSSLTVGSNFAGCYAVTATDTLGNASLINMPACVDNCPLFTIGNVFTPNGDGINDYFRPLDYRSVALRKFAVFDRWGTQVHVNTTDIEQLWNGIVDYTSKPASEGVYYYYIEYEEVRLGGNEIKSQTGWVTLFR